MITRLTLSERRVFGVLVEKALSQPEYYPMTLNAILAACNQKSNRDPVIELNDDEVWRTLDGLREQGLIGRVLPAPGARSDRFKHEAQGHYGWGHRQQAIMAELLLRGPQTLNELRTRCGRMVAFESPEAVATCLDGLAQADPPMVRVLPRGPGQRETRYAHMLYPPNEQAAEAAGTSAADEAEAAHAVGGAPQPTGQAGVGSSANGAPSVVPRTAAVHGAGVGSQRSAAAPGDVKALQDEIEALHGEIADLHSAIGELRRRLDRLEGSA